MPEFQEAGQRGDLRVLILSGGEGVCPGTGMTAEMRLGKVRSYRAFGEILGNLCLFRKQMRDFKEKFKFVFSERSGGV